MAAETTRRGPKSTGLIIRPQGVSDKSYVESVVGFIHEVVPQGKQGEKEVILWVKFDYCDINDYNLIREEGEHNANHPPLLLILGYTNGVQIWCIPASGEAQEVLSWREGPVKFLKLLSSPESAPSLKDRFVANRPLVAICDSTSAGEQFCSLNFISLKSGDRVDCIKFSSQIADVKCSKRVIAVVFQNKVVVFDAYTLKETIQITSCYTTPGFAVNPVALGTRWVAFANKKLVSVHQSGGGMAGDGVQSYAATIIHAAKTITKGLTMFGETVASSLGGPKLGSKSSTVKNDPKNSKDSQPGIVTILDTLAVNGEVNIDEDSEGDGIIAHFPAHANEPVAALEFDPSGMLLFTSCRLGHSFHVFRIFPHPASSAMGAVHHLYTLHRGETTSKVQDVAFSLDSRWISVSTMRGTTHIFPITPYGGPITVRTHTSPRVVNRLSRFHRSAGLEEIQQSPSTGRNSPVLSGSPSSSASNLARAYDTHPSMAYQTGVMSRMGNSRLPPYPHPTTIQPLAQLKQVITFPLAGGAAPKSPGKEKTYKRNSLSSEIMCVSSAFAPPRAWLVGSPSLTRDKRDKPAMDSLFIINWMGILTEYVMEPRPSSTAPKTDDSPIELEVTAHAQWNLLRLPSSVEIQPPLPNTNPLMFTPDMFQSQENRRKSNDSGLSPKDLKSAELEESWLSEVEIITHAGPHRRLWMGPQFSFQTFQHSSNTTVLSSNSSALLSQSPDSQTPLTPDIFTEELEVQSLRPARSNPVAMPGSHQSSSGSPGSLLFIEASSGSFEQLPSMLEVCGSWPDNCPSLTPSKGREEQLKESLADAMIEDPFDALRSGRCSDSRKNFLSDFQGSCEELSSSSSHSGSVSHCYDANAYPQSLDHTLVFPSSRGSPDSS
ncbi:BCAS3 microtubule associated cell migration factor isoform X2 [Parasteatoda tepidariorum]|uniref:BCAS3 microtubule associated cell migration factor isoform X2 n=1 Tax=Parasteatoda tepidariorum TaxID=114398 RepID=UPI001C71C66C|nr:BCAS3 microtubule associated cell migration factor isoform X2 [Parasteatoda tepidariorum]